MDIYHDHKFVEKAAANVTKREKKKVSTSSKNFYQPSQSIMSTRHLNHSVILPGLVTGLSYSSEPVVAHFQTTGVKKKKNPQIEEASLSAQQRLAPALPLSPSACISV